MSQNLEVLMRVALIHVKMIIVLLNVYIFHECVITCRCS